MRYTETCKHCGHIKCSYVHRLNAQLIKALRQLVDFFDSTHDAAKLQTDLDLTKNQYNNFQKLQYFGLVTRTEHGWYPTSLAQRFIYGETDILNGSITFNGEVVPLGSDLYRNAKIRTINIKDIDITLWKKREEYQSEKGSGYPTLFEFTN